MIIIIFHRRGKPYKVQADSCWYERYKDPFWDTLKFIWRGDFKRHVLRASSILMIELTGGEIGSLKSK